MGAPVSCGRCSGLGTDAQGKKCPICGGRGVIHTTPERLRAINAVELLERMFPDVDPSSKKEEES